MVIQEVLHRKQELWRWEAQWPAIESQQQQNERFMKLILLKLHETLPKNSTSIILWWFGIWSKLKRWKISINGYLLTSPKEKKMSFWNIFSYSIQQQWTISWLDCDMWQKVDFIQQPATTSSVVGLRRSSKAIPKAKLALKNGHSHCLVVCCLSDPPQLSESQWNHYIWEVCSANWWDALKTATPAARIGQQNVPNSSPW